MGAKALAIAGSGQTVQGVLQDMDTGRYWNGSALEVYASGHWTLYHTDMPEDSGSGRYIWTMPGGVPNGNYWLTPYLLEAPPVPVLGGDNALDLLRIGWRDGNIIDLASAINVGQINGSAQAAVNLSLSANTLVSGAVAAGTLLTTQMTTNLTSLIPNNFNGRTLYFTSGANVGIVALVTAYVVAGGRLTFIGFNNLPLPVAPAPGDTFVII